MGLRNSENIYGGVELTQAITVLKDAHLGETLWIVGTGPSLQFLRCTHFGAGPVMAVNRSINLVRNLALPNVLYSMQKDGGDKKRCPNCGEFCGAVTPPPLGVPLIVQYHASEKCFPTWEPRYIMDLQKDFGIPWWLFSIATCAHLARLMGCAKVVYLCCDSMKGDLQSYVVDHNGIGTLVKQNCGYGRYPGLLGLELKKLGMSAEYVYPEEK